MIPLFKVYMNENAAKKSSEILMSGYIGQGIKVEEFEKDLKDFLDHDYLLTTNCGTSALHLALHMLKKPYKKWQGLNQDDEILTTAMTCLYRNSQVLLPNGKTMFIADMVNNKYDGYVMSYNIDKDILEQKKVINWYKSPLGDRKFIRLNHEKSIGKKSLSDNKDGVWVTDDHPVLTDNGYIKSSDLNNSSFVATKHRKLNKNQENALYGMMLGDGNIRTHIGKNNSVTARYSHTHSYLQEEFGDIKIEIFNDFNIKKLARKNYNNSKNGFMWITQSKPYFFDIYKKFYENGKKILPIDFSDDNLSELGLAIWYMDDGSYHKKQGYSVLCSESFTISENMKLKQILLNKFNIKSFFIKRSNSVRICFNKTETEKLFSIIGKYIIPIMRYKMSNISELKYKFDKSLWNLGKTDMYYDKVNIIKDKLPTNYDSKMKSVYCIDVEDNHNFISGGIVLHNCTATNWPILANGLKIKWVDIDEKTLNLDLDDLERKITPKTKVIIVVHWGGYPVDLDRIKEIQKKTEEIYGFKPVVIEDCAHAFGSSYKKKMIGTHGNMCMFSFQAIKHLTTVDGGLLTVPHEELYRRGKLLRWYGIDRDTNKKDFRCLHPTTIIKFADGSTDKIRNVVNKKIDKEILVYENGIFVKRKIKKWIKSELGNRYYLNVSTEKSKNKHNSKLTNDHLLYSKNRGWVRTDELFNGEEILTSFLKPNKKQEELIIGSLLGDANLSVKKTKTDSTKGVLSETHCVLQEEYSKLKISALDKIYSTTHYYDSFIDRRGVKNNGKIIYSTKSLPYFGDLRKEFYPNGKKLIPRKLIENYFSDFMLAVWFMDDGRTQVSNSINGLKYNCDLSTYSFEKEDVEWLIELLNKKGYECNIYKTNKRNTKNDGYSILFSREGSNQLINNISKYVPPSMRYKVGHVDNNYDPSLWELGEPIGYYDKVIIEKNKYNNYKTTYCLEMESDHHNFMTTNLVVHNCESNIEEWGFKFHMNDVNASIGIENLKDISGIIKRHQSNAYFYDENLKNINGLTLLERNPDMSSSYWIYSMLVENRDGFYDKMKESGIMVSQVHERNDKHSCVWDHKTHLPTLDRIIGKIVSIPVGWWVSKEEREYIVEKIKEGW